MKKVLSVAVIALAGVMIFASCGKKCVCTYYEDGDKVMAYTDNDTRVFEKDLCKNQSVDPHQGLSQVIDGKEVTVEIKCK